ncbi:efflux RND transporter periplasmic adaptor subunit [Pseudomonas syringae]|uniref:efflux RND transporter periplasmic adaptor subunit n=1 Tax=Pseudomonas syringae TaxID=317 RepID=UPI000730EF61|nr:efflux RND transporter periplasmic adaptor subunit [Pseudomonas syringae]KTC03123.1 cytochrome C peroxidase [Pseudomonas syringae ICMP 11292]
MNNKRSIAIALAVVVIIGLGSLTVSQQMLPFAAETDASDKKPADKEHGHESEDAHGDDDHASDPKKASAAAAEQPHEEEEEGHIELTAEQIKTAGIELATAEPRQMSTTVTFPGEIRFDEDRTAHVVPRVSGVVESVKVDLGQAVKKGQVLAVIASQQISDQRSELNAAQRRQELARLTLQREKKLWEDKISAEQDYLQARQDFQEADINLANARQKISAIGASLSPSAGNRYELIAPFDSMVVEKHLGIGEMVNEASNAFTLSDLSRVWATFGVAPRDLDKVVVGRPVIVSAPDLNARVEGKIGYVGSLLGEQTRAAAVRVTLANPQGAWRPGLFVSVEVAAEQSSVAVSVPDSAIQSIEEKPSVFVRNAEGFQLTPVTLGRRDGGHVEIVKGLAAGTQVAAAGSFTLKSELGKGSAEHAH